MTTATEQLRQRFLSRCRSQPVRTMRQFAEDELILPADGGPHQGEHFRIGVQPWTGLLLHEIDHGQWSEIISTAPSQCGKTLIQFVLAVLYVVAELRRNVVIGLPDEEMFSDKWNLDIRPVIAASPRLAAELLPRRGPGSKEGRVKEAVTLGNGCVLKPMTPSGGESSRSGFTSTHVVVTELYAFDGDPLAELVARQGATSVFTEDGRINTDRRLFGEGTLTTVHELPWTARSSGQRESGLISTESEIYNPCPHCGEYSLWERQHLAGWQGCDTAIAAAKASAFFCPKCGEAITDLKRREAVRRCVLVHSGQTVAADGTVSGEIPLVPRLFFRVNGFNNLFARAADFGLAEWQAAQFEVDSPERASAEKSLTTKVWCVPYEPQQFEAAPLQRKEIRKRISRWPENVLPPDTQWFTVGVDPGRWQIWYWGMVARATGELCCVFADCLDTSVQTDGEVTEQHEYVAILAALRVLADRLDGGFPIEGGAVRVPDQVWIDEGYHRSQAAVWAICKERGTGVKGPWLPVKGIGKSSAWEHRGYTAPQRTTSEVRLIDQAGRFDLRYMRAKRGFCAHLDADASKLSVQAALKTRAGLPGSLVLWDAPEKRLITASRHLASEVYKRYLHPTKGVVEEWAKSGQNHLLDCAGYALAAMWRMGYGVAATGDGHGQASERGRSPVAEAVETIAAEQDVRKAEVRQAVTSAKSWWED